MSEVTPVEHWRCGLFELRYKGTFYELFIEGDKDLILRIATDALRDLKALLEKVEL